MVDIDRWKTLPIHIQMGNIGSEVCRTINLCDKRSEYAVDSFYRALELLDITLQSHTSYGCLKELCRVRELLCAIVVQGDEGNKAALKKYFNDFAMIRSAG